MASKTFTDEELNYFRICYIVTRVVPEELRKFFKQEWDKFFKATHGEWRDTAKNAIDFYNMESPRNRTRNKELLKVMANGNTSEWDCTCLFYALLYSDSLGKSLKRSPASTSIDALRKIRNEVFAHTIDINLEDVDFQASVQKVLTAFSTLKLDTAAIEDMKNQKSFLTDELSSVRQQLEREKKRNAELLSFCVLPPKPSHDTTERLEEVSSIYEEMTKLRKAKKNETTVTYMSGNPGCGKSEMARQIAQKYFKEEADKGADLRFVFTLNGFSLETLLQSYVEFAGQLNCDQDCLASINTAKDLSKEEKIAQIRGFIATRIQTYSTWLILVDNVVDLKSVFQYLPQAGERTIGKGQILVTTQDSQSVPKSDSYTFHTSLSPGMKQEDSIALLCQVSGLETNDDTLEVAKALDFQPLALACAAVYMKHICSTAKPVPWGKYLEKLQNDQREATEAAYKETSLSYRTTMTTAVKLALEREVDQNEVMMHAFQFLSYVAPDPIPVKYAVQYVKNCMPEQDDDLLAARISSSSLVISSSDDCGEVRLHQVVLHCLQTVLSETNARKSDVLFDVVLAFSDISSFDLNNISVITETRRLVSHFTTIAGKLQPFIEEDTLPVLIRKQSLLTSFTTKLKGLFQSRRRSPAARDVALASKLALVTKCLSNVGDICFVHGCYQASYTCFQVCFKIQQEIVNDENDPSLAVTQTNMGHCCLELGQLDNARICLERALTIQDHAYPDNHPSVATTLNILSTTMRYLGQYEQAKIYLERALAIEERFYGSNHPVSSATLNNLGCTFRELNLYEQSKYYLERSLAIEERVSGENHPAVAVRLNNLALTLEHLRQHTKDKEHLEKALLIDQNVYGKNHPLVATRLTNLAGSYHALGQYGYAKTCIEKSIAIKENVLGATNSSVVGSLLVLGTILIDSGQNKDAKICLQRALATIESTHPKMNHPLSAALWSNLGRAFHDLGKLREAKSCFEKAVFIYTSSQKLSNLAVVLSNLGSVVLDLGQYQEAKDCLDQAILLQEDAYGTEHLSLNNTLRNLGRTYHRLEQHDKAKACFERALGILYKTFDESHPKCALLLNHLGALLQDMGQYQDAKANLQKALEIQQNLFGEDSILVAGTLKNFAKTIHAMGQQKEAELILEKVLKIQEKIYDANNPYVAETLAIKGEFLFESGQHGESRECFESALAIQEQVYDEGHPQLLKTRGNLQRMRTLADS